MRYALTEHARQVITARKIAIEWVERTLIKPALVQSDPGTAGLSRLYCPIVEMEGRVLRVVVDLQATPVRIISVFFDRTMKGKL